MPWYEVMVKASQQIVVEACSIEEAVNIAYDEAFGGESDCVKECDYPIGEVDGNHLETLKRHADLVIEGD